MKTLISAIASLSVIAVLSSCEEHQFHPTSTDDLGDFGAASGPKGPFAPERTKLLVFGMQDSDARMANEATLEATLGVFDVPRRPRQNLRAWINAIERSDSRLLKGLGGLAGHTVLDIANRTLDAGDIFADRPGVETWGVIEKSVDGQNGYYWDGVEDGGSGWLWVTMYTTTTLGASDQRRTTALRYKVEVTGGFRVDDKDVDTPGNVFGDFASGGGFAVNSVTASGFNWKLWAVGNSIRVTKLYRNNNVEANPDNFVEIQPNNPKYQHIFDPDPSACIDMMFADVDGVPQTLPDNAKPPYYCLGRCANPPIINTK